MSRKRKNKMNEQVQTPDQAAPQPPVQFDENGNPIVTEEFTQTEAHTGETLKPGQETTVQ